MTDATGFFCAERGRERAGSCTSGTCENEKDEEGQLADAYLN